jgi:hypothetical protein
MPHSQYIHNYRHKRKYWDILETENLSYKLPGRVFLATKTDQRKLTENRLEGPAGAINGKKD